MSNAYPDNMTGNLQRNMNTLTSMITGIIIGKEKQLPKITEKRFKRSIINETVIEQTYFLPFVQSLPHNLALEEIVLSIDGSLVGRGCICLTIKLSPPYLPENYLWF